ncbi:Alpha/beta hydrolase family protein [Caulifigura coniformis]|uniref:Alpha/beta hydrolase family protein n=1 Tax=Caulifigura coniformis TaxID=2527983 RepID=A0A517SHL2_9PLAN|nr:hypothetical protein [Caulifigura coniformis]QDT55613.1 Alpha/beta hydrolase family protein [Caulifigura coniformis]
MRYAVVSVVLAAISGTAWAQQQDVKPLEGTAPLRLEEPLDVDMVRGINAFAEQEIVLSRERRKRHWHPDFSNHAAYDRSVADNRARLRTLIGAVDERLPPGTRQIVLPENLERLPTFPGVTAEFVVTGEGPGEVILVPDANWAPEHITGKIAGLRPEEQLAHVLAEMGIATRTLRLANRSSEFSGRPDLRSTNQPHREYLYRPAFELGRHIIGYEVQKILRAVDELEAAGKKIVVWGIGEGGLLALYAAAIDPRIELCVVSGSFGEREQIWQEPIYRNVWRLLDEFGDAEMASLIAPRSLVIEDCMVPEIAGPPPPSPQRSGAAPGQITTPSPQSVEREFHRARATYERLGVANRIQILASSAPERGRCGTAAALQAVASRFPGRVPGKHSVEPLAADEASRRLHDRQRELVDDLRRYTQRLLHGAAKERDKYWASADRKSLAAWEETSEAYRTQVYDELIGRIPYGLLPPNARSRQVIDEPTHTGYEVVLDVFRSEADGSQPIIAGGILLIPKDLKPGEKRPCVVCQHGLEGTPMDTIVTDPNQKAYGPYKGFSTQLVQRGFIVYAPQNPYRGKDEFRVIQRKSNPLGRSLFSYIIPQHQQTLNWLATLPFVDADRIGFYGLSYGGKTAMRIPPLLPPRPAHNGEPARPGYCLSICSADFNEWILKNASTEDRYSYVFTNEYEIFEWNMGNVANYAELASLMTPRPFMVERGHDDGVAPDEWVAWEFAKVKRHYDRLGIGDRTEMEVFNGPHTINGKGTFDFLHRHLNWPVRPED